MVTAYGEGWQEEGRRHLAEAALRYLGRERTAGARAAGKNPLSTGSAVTGVGTVTTATATAAVAVAAVVAAAITVGTTGGPASARGPAGGGSGQPVTSAASSGPGSGSTAGGGALPALPLAVSSGQTPVSGYTYVTYHDGGDSTATLSGDVSGAAAGEVVRLYAQQFPYTGAPVADRSSAVGADGSYAFKVAPTLATRYQVPLFKDAAATTPVAASAATTVYVTMPDGVLASKSGCTRPVCQLQETFDLYAPPSAPSTEMAKKWFGYFAVNLVTSGQAASPTQLQVDAGEFSAGGASAIASDEFQVTFDYTFTVGSDGYAYHAIECEQDSPSVDGIGLPFAHTCGAPSITVPHGYLG
ncbi:MAG TPA: hypothetical protein VIZ43_23840 [Trebonia sp.]